VERFPNTCPPSPLPRQDQVESKPEEKTVLKGRKKKKKAKRRPSAPRKILRGEEKKERAGRRRLAHGRAKGLWRKGLAPNSRDKQRNGRDKKRGDRREELIHSKMLSKNFGLYRRKSARTGGDGGEGGHEIAGHLERKGSFNWEVRC